MTWSARAVAQPLIDLPRRTIFNCSAGLDSGDLGDCIVTPQELAALSAVLSLGAAIASAVAAWRVPHSVAKYMERRRAENDLISRKTAILDVLMTNRATVGSRESTAALNSIFLVFRENPKVISAFKRFIQGTEMMPVDGSFIVERYKAIIASIVEDLGLGANISPNEIDQHYFPTVMMRQLEAEMHDIDRRLQEKAFGANVDSPNI